jgi:hypothetical protein
MSPASAGPPPRGRFTIVYLIHEAFRRDLQRLSAALRTPGLDARRARQLAGHWSFVENQLHHHHEVEDASLWPLVRPKLSEDEERTVLAEMESQHQELLPACAALDASFAALPDDPSKGPAVADDLDALAGTLGTHLTQEETRCFPVVDRALSVEEFESFGKATAKSIGMRGSAQFFPWIFDGADPVERAAVLSMPPPPVRIICGAVWEPRYAKRAGALWGS